MKTVLRDGTLYIKQQQSLFCPTRIVVAEAIRRAIASWRGAPCSKGSSARRRAYWFFVIMVYCISRF